MLKPDPTMTPRIVVCASDECTPRGSMSRPHPVSADCKHPRTVEAPKPIEKRDEQ